MKQLIIFSFHGDRSTNRLIDWLVHLNCPFKRINLEDECVSNISISFHDGCSHLELLLFCGERITFDSNTICFIRGGYFKNSKINVPKSIIDKKELVNHLYNELEAIEQFFYKFVNDLSICGVFEMPEHNKVFQLMYAQKVGLKIPDTSIISESKSLNRLFYDAKYLALKGIHNNFVSNTSHQQSIQRVEKIEISKIPENFFPCAFQEIINKQYEVRVFYFENTFYAIKIQELASNNEIIDMRDKYSSNHYSQYPVCETLQTQIKKLFSELNIRSASLDLLRINDDYVFLEVNYTGQYDWVSGFGGFDIHRDIAYYLQSSII